MNRSFGKVQVKRARADLSEIPEDCGYEKRFRYNIDMNNNGISGECIEWCQINCKHKWGWWFEQKDLYSTAWHNWEEQNAYMSFASKKEAMKFWLTLGVGHIAKARDN